MIHTSKKNFYNSKFTWWSSFPDDDYAEAGEKIAFNVIVKMNSLEILERIKLALEIEDLPLFGGEISSYKITPVWYYFKEVDTT
jgi:hypothetical protein